MRQRFKPNITPRGARKANSTTSASSTTKTATKKQNNSAPAIENVDDQQQSNEPFIPPNSSKTIEENTICEEIQSIEDTSEVIVLETTVETLTEQNNSKAPKTSNSNDNSKKVKPAATRRSRLKPKITPVSRKRNTTRTTANDSNVDIVNETPSSVKTQTVREDKEKSALSKEVQKENKKNALLTSTTTVEEVTTNVETPSTTPQIPDTPTDTHTHGELTESSNKTQTGGSSISRRRRATPKICIPTRKKRTISTSRDVIEKSNDQASESLQEQDDGEMEQELPESLPLCKANKRQRIQEDTVEEDISVVEVTVETGKHQEVAVVQEDEQQPVEEQQPKNNKKATGRKRRAQIRKPKEKLDSSKMTLQDLIYFNPKENKMKSNTDSKRRRTEEKRTTSQSTENLDDSMTIDENNPNSQQTEGDGDSTVCAPQVKMAPDGSIIVDEESLLIRSPTHSTLEETEIVYEDANNVNFDFYGKSIKRKHWTTSETLKFYKALSQVGTDFQLMVPLFPRRSRKELKAKFKREEKQNYHLVDRVLVHRTPISLEMFLKPGKDKSESSNKDSQKQTEAPTKEPLIEKS